MRQLSTVTNGSAGCVLELGGVAGAGLMSTIPGGLFEPFFAVWILVRGFCRPSVAPTMKLA